MINERAFADKFRVTVQRELAQALRCDACSDSREHVEVLPVVTLPPGRQSRRALLIAGVAASAALAAALAGAVSHQVGREASTNLADTTSVGGQEPRATAPPSPHKVEAVVSEGIRTFLGPSLYTLASRDGCLVDEARGFVLALDTSWRWDAQTATLTSVATGKSYGLGDDVEMAGNGYGRLTIPEACAHVDLPLRGVWDPAAGGR